MSLLLPLLLLLLSIQALHQEGSPFFAHAQPEVPHAFAASFAASAAMAAVEGGGFVPVPTADCPEGFYCPTETTNMRARPCPQDPKVYCPAGSARPQPTARGHYAVDNHLDSTGGGYGGQLPCKAGEYCVDGQRHLCPGGRYGSLNREYRSECSGVCRAGYYCPPGSISSTQEPCGIERSKYCPEGSAGPKEAERGYYTVEGSPTPYYNQSVAEDDPNDPDFTKWRGDEHPYPLDASDPSVVTQLRRNHSLTEIARHRVNQSICEPGYYCTGGMKFMCSAGRFGSEYGLVSGSCSGLCGAGYYCPEGSTSPTQHPCGGANFYCPRGSGWPMPVGPGFYSINGYDDLTRFAERKCEPGHYCVGGLRYSCPAGRYGSVMGLMDKNCSGPCASGYYCPIGSISDKEVKCGDASLYCPEGSGRPTKVPKGYYSVGVKRVMYEIILGLKHPSWQADASDEATRADIALSPPGFYALAGSLYRCPAGRYGAIAGLDSPSCSGLCSVSGFYCPAGSTSPLMRVCGGDNYYCPKGTVAPIRVPLGFYTADYTTSECGAGYFRNWTGLSIDPTIHQSSRFVTTKAVPPCELCPFGKFKTVAGDDYSLCRDCDSRYAIKYIYGDPIYGVSPASNHRGDRVQCECDKVPRKDYSVHFNISTGMCDSLPTYILPTLSDDSWGHNISLTRTRAFQCEPGHSCSNGLRSFCPAGRYGGRTKEIRPGCQGLCEKGYYCPQGSVSPYSVPCGQSNYICPTGSKLPTIVPEGYYSNEDSPETLRYESFICPKGYFCPGDGKRYQCPPGTFTDEEGTSSSTCMGPCDRGFYCVAGSPSRQQYPCGNSSVYCPRGSSAPKPVHEGFYCIHTGIDGGEQDFWDLDVSRCSVEIPCEPGYYCSGGIKRPCPPGRYGWRHGLNSSECSGPCAPGYYCPSILRPQPDAPPHTVWPGKPHIHAAQLECGGPEFFCPQGSHYPQIVSSGYYSTGGGNLHGNMTRSSQRPCEPGSYCAGGVSVLCQPGVYGQSSRLTRPLCDGWCPAGHYCPSGTAEPLPCPENSFSVGAASLCKQCPGAQRTTPMVCKNMRTCCFRGM